MTYTLRPAAVAGWWDILSPAGYVVGQIHGRREAAQDCRKRNREAAAELETARKFEAQFRRHEGAMQDMHARRREAAGIR